MNVNLLLFLFLSSIFLISCQKSVQNYSSSEYETCLDWYKYIYDINFSRDGEHFAFLSTDNWESRNLNIDWEVKKISSSASSLTFSDNWKSYSYLADNKFIQDNIEKFRYNYLSSEINFWGKKPILSWNGDSYILIAKDDINNNISKLVKDGEIIWDFFSISKFWYSKDGKSFAYIYDDTEDFDHNLISKDGIILSNFHNVFDFAYWESKEEFALINKKDWVFTLYINSKPIYSSSETLSDIHFAKNNMIYFTEYDKGLLKYKNWETTLISDPKFSYISEFFISNDESHIAYIWEYEWNETLVIDNVEKYVSQDNILFTKFSEDFNNYAVLDLNKLIKDNIVIPGNISEFIFSPVSDDFFYVDWGELYWTNCSLLHL